MFSDGQEWIDWLILDFLSLHTYTVWLEFGAQIEKSQKVLDFAMFQNLVRVHL